MGARNIVRLLGDALIGGNGFDIDSTETLAFLPKVDDTGSMTVGDGTTDMDLKVFLGATTDYVEFNVGDGQMNIEGAEIHLGDNDAIEFGDGNDVVMKWDGTYLHGRSSGLWANAPSPADPNYTAIAHEFLDDFNYPASATASDVIAYTSNDDGATGTNAFQDASRGVYNVVTAAADNDYHAMSSVSEAWLFESGKKLWFEARFRLAEATTNESAWWFGLTDTLTTGGFQANAAGPLASYDGALIWKDEATLLIDFETSNAGTQATTTNTATFVSNTWTTVGFYFDGTATTSTITPYVDGTAGTAQNITLSGLEEMHMVFGVKAGPSGGAETLQVDYIKVVQLR
jgi:hypothetical protein